MWIMDNLSIAAILVSLAVVAAVGYCLTGRCSGRD